MRLIIDLLGQCSSELKQAFVVQCDYSPCVACAHLIAESGYIYRVEYLKPYRDDRGVEILKAVGVEVEQVT